MKWENGLQNWKFKTDTLIYTGLFKGKKGNYFQFRALSNLKKKEHLFRRKITNCRGPYNRSVFWEIFKENMVNFQTFL